MKYDTVNPETAVYHMTNYFININTKSTAVLNESSDNGTNKQVKYVNYIN